MTKNNLKVVKTDSKKQQELKEKNKSLEAAISQIDQNFGKGSVMRLGQQQALDVEAISTGSLSLDLALGIGGLPKGSFTSSCRGSKGRWNMCFCRCRACNGSGLCEEVRC